MDSQPSVNESGVDVYAKMLDTVVRAIPPSRARDLWIDAINVSRAEWEKTHDVPLLEKASYTLLTDALKHMMSATALVAAVLGSVSPKTARRSTGLIRGLPLLNSLLAELIAYGDNWTPLTDTSLSRYRDGVKMIVIGITRPNHVMNPITQLHLQDTYHQSDTVCIRVSAVRLDTNNPVIIELGDQVWWQDKIALWTPKCNRDHTSEGCGVEWDIRLEKIGYSHSSSHYASLSKDEIDSLIKGKSNEADA